MQKAGIIGLPNVGKSTLFNALIKNHHAEVSNYPFCTIEPNVGIVNLPDDKLTKIAEIVKVTKIIPAAFEFIDIAGLVKGSSKGEGLGNQFLSHIREVDAVIHVVRCFEDTNIAHVEGSVDPIRDIETINIELVLSDLQSIDKKTEAILKKTKGNDKASKQQVNVLEKIKSTLNKGGAVKEITRNLEKEDLEFFNSLFLLSAKPLIYALNFTEADLQDVKNNNYYKQVEDYALKTNSKCVPINAKLEEELIGFSEEEKLILFEGKKPLQETGIETLIKEAFDLLGLIKFYTSVGNKEVRAWAIPKNTKAPQAAGKVHSDFEKGFIKSEIIKYSDLIKLGSKPLVKEKGLVHLEGRDYIIQDGDIVEFKFNV